MENVVAITMLRYLNTKRLDMLKCRQKFDILTRVIPTWMKQRIVPSKANLFHLKRNCCVMLGVAICCVFFYDLQLGQLVFLHQL